MGIKKLTPTSPARRYQTYLTRDELTVGAVPEKSLLEPKTRISGRNSDGRITVRRRGGGHKRFYRMIDFKRDKDGVPGRVTQIEYDPNRSSNIALVTYLDGEKRYIIAPVGLEVGKMIASGEEADILPGNTLPIRNIPLGTQIHNIELRPGKGGQMARAAGSFAQLLSKEGQQMYQSAGRLVARSDLPQDETMRTRGAQIVPVDPAWAESFDEDSKLMKEIFSN